MIVEVKVKEKHLQSKGLFESEKKGLKISLQIRGSGAVVFAANVG